MEKVSLCRAAFPPPRLLHFTCSSSSQDCAIVLFKVSWAINLSLLFPFGLRIGQLEIALLENILVLRTQRRRSKESLQILLVLLSECPAKQAHKSCVTKSFIPSKPVEYTGHQAPCSTTAPILLFKNWVFSRRISTLLYFFSSAAFNYPPGPTILDVTVQNVRLRAGDTHRARLRPQRSSHGHGAVRAAPELRVHHSFHCDSSSLPQDL